MKPLLAIVFAGLLSVAVTTGTPDTGVPASIVSVALPGCGDNDCPVWQGTDCCDGYACNEP